MDERVSDESLLIRFYRGLSPDTAGRHLDDIWTWDHRRLEMVHDYIQWFFPSVEPSRFNPDAPLLTARDIAQFHADADLKARLLRSFDVMLTFYGLQRAGVGIVRAASFPQRAPVWLTPINHNHLRLTRILICLATLGWVSEAQALLMCLEDIVEREGRAVISKPTLRFWREAVPAS